MPGPGLWRSHLHLAWTLPGPEPRPSTAASSALPLWAAQVTGISSVCSFIILNIPFFIFGYKKIGAFFTISSLFSILCLSGWSTFIHYERVTSDPFLSTITAASSSASAWAHHPLGRFPGRDGSPGHHRDRRTPFSVGETIMFFNLFILGSSGFVFSWDSAMYSLVAYFIAYKMIDVVTNASMK